VSFELLQLHWLGGLMVACQNYNGKVMGFTFG